MSPFPRVLALSFLAWALPVRGVESLPGSAAPVPAADDPPPVLARYDLSPGGGIQLSLPWVLQEVSGLAVSPDGRLFAHNDERAALYQLDPETGTILKTFSAGFPALAGDFEGIAIAGERFFLVTSAGELVELREGAHGSAMGYQRHRTGLGRVCEVEGLAHDPREDALLIPCKTPLAPELREHLTVWAVELKTLRLYPVPRVFLPLERLREVGLGPTFHPSSVEVHPATGALVLSASREEALLELSPRGRPLAGRKLSSGVHPQPEGITFLPDGTLLLADEGRGGPGRLTRYPPLPGEEGPGG